MLGLLLAVWELLCRKAGRDAAAALARSGPTRCELIVDPFFDRRPAGQRACSGICRPSCSGSRSAYALAAVVGVVLGTLVGQSIWAMRGLDPIFQVLRTVPPLAWLPLVARRFPRRPAVGDLRDLHHRRSGRSSSIPRSASATFRRITATSRRCCGSISFEFFWKIMVPSAAPYIFTGLRIGIGLSWLAIVAAEMLTGGVGIGFFIWDAWNSSHLQRHHARARLYRHRRLPARPASSPASPPSSPAAPRPTEKSDHDRLSAARSHRQDLHARLDRDRSAARHHVSASRRASTSRSSAIRAAARVDAAQHRRRTDCRRRTAARAAGGREINDPGPGSRRGVPEPLACCRGSRSTTMCGSPSTRCSPAKRRAPSGTPGRCTISISCRWCTPRTSGRRKSPAA